MLFHSEQISLSNPGQKISLSRNRLVPKMGIFHIQSFLHPIGNPLVAALVQGFVRFSDEKRLPISFPEFLSRNDLYNFSLRI